MRPKAYFGLRPQVRQQLDAWQQGLLIECDDQDLENTVGSWELYGYEDEKRYPKTQSEFFERAAAPLTRKSALLALIFGGMAHGRQNFGSRDL